MRRCLVTGEVRPVAELLRFVVAPDGSIVPDMAGRLPGRGLWVQSDRAVLDRACSRNLFRRAARADVAVPSELASLVEAQILQRCLDLIGLARRAKEAVFGFEKAREWLQAERAALLIAAADGDPRDRARLRALAAGLPVLDALSADDIGRATGRERTVHGVVAKGRLATSIRSEGERLMRLRSGNEPGTQSADDRITDKASRGHE
jgi:Predicted nucleic-acid-binding protein implicated in transcription termination